MKRRSIGSEKENQQEYSVEYIDTESDEDDTKTQDKEYSVEYIDTESDEDKTENKDKDSDIEYSDDEDANNDGEDDSGNVDSDNISSETDKGGDSSGSENSGGGATIESKVTLGDMIADIDNCEPGTLLLDILEVYLAFMATLYFFVLICS